GRRHRPFWITSSWGRNGLEEAPTCDGRDRLRAHHRGVLCGVGALGYSSREGHEASKIAVVITCWVIADVSCGGHRRAVAARRTSAEGRPIRPVIDGPFGFPGVISTPLQPPVVGGRCGVSEVHTVVPIHVSPTCMGVYGPCMGVYGVKIILRNF